MRVLLALTPLLLMAACVPEGQPRLHEIVLYGAENVRLSYLYGTPTTLRIGEKEVALERANGQSDDPLAIDQALSIDGEPYLRERLPALSEAPTTVTSISASSDLRVAVRRDTGPILYYDGSMWFTLLGDGRAGVDTRVVPRPLIGGLRGLGELTRAEADALQRYLESGGPTAVTLLDEVPARPRVSDGASEYLRTAFYLQREFASTAPVRRTPQQDVVWEVLADGNQAVGFENQAFYLVNDTESLRTLWNRAYGSRLQVPPLPDVDFSRETVVALFMGGRPTGGYSIAVEAVSMEASDAYLDVRMSEPAEGSFTTQALTSPWLMVRILRGGIDTAWIRRAGSDELIGAATPFSGR